MKAFPDYVRLPKPCKQRCVNVIWREGLWPDRRHDMRTSLLRSLTAVCALRSGFLVPQWSTNDLVRRRMPTVSPLLSATLSIIVCFFSSRRPLLTRASWDGALAAVSSLTTDILIALQARRYVSTATREWRCEGVGLCGSDSLYVYFPRQ